MKSSLEYSVIISTCDKFSDLWDIYFELFFKNWHDHPAKVYLVTDAPTDQYYEGVEIVAAGEGTEITERLRKVFETIDTKYLLFTLDDYFLTQHIDNSKIDTAFSYMDDEAVDYVRLYGASKYYLLKERAQESAKYPGFFLRDISEGNYKVNLYAGLWRTDFMKKTLGDTPLNAWQYEVSLTQKARDLKARCALSNNREFPILDVIRKGKLLHRADRVLRENGYVLTTREKIAYSTEFSIWSKTKLRHILPGSELKKLKQFMIKRGHTYYSKD